MAVRLAMMLYRTHIQIPASRRPVYVYKWTYARFSLVRRTVLHFNGLR